MKFARSFLENACFWKLGPTLSPSRRVCGRVVVEDDDSSESGGNLDQLTGAVPRNPGNHSTYPPQKKNMRCEKHISYHLINSQNGQGSTSPCTVSRARLKSWNDTLVRCQGRSYPAIQVARPNDVNLSMSTTQGAFPVRLRPIRSMTSVTVLSAMISLTFCFWSIACKSCRTETESPTLRGCENRTTTAYKHFTQNSN